MAGHEVYDNHVNLDLLFRMAMNLFVFQDCHHHKADLAGFVRLFNDPNLLAKMIVEWYVDDCSTKRKLI